MFSVLDEIVFEKHCCVRVAKTAPCESEVQRLSRVVPTRKARELIVLRVCTWSANSIRITRWCDCYPSLQRFLRFDFIFDHNFRLSSNEKPFSALSYTYFLH